MKAVAILLVCILAMLLIWNLTDHATVCVGGRTVEVSISESWQLRTLLLMKETDFVVFGCPFSADFSIRMDGLTYCIAQDDCETVYIPELGFYYKTHKDNHRQLREIMLDYSGKVE